MIPNFNQSGVLPPFLPDDSPVNPNAVSPYKVPLIEFVKHFNTSKERKKILLGFLNYRAYLKKNGIKDGFQWIDGSFTEHIEDTQKRPPKDIDVVSFIHRPSDFSSYHEWRAFITLNPSLFSQPHIKKQYMCDAYLVDMDLDPKHIIAQTAYWHGLFSHQRDTYLWKGMLQISLADSEIDSLKSLREDENAA